MEHRRCRRGSVCSAAGYREGSGGLLLPMVIHIAGNVGAFLGGLTTIVLRVIITREMPTPSA